MDVPAMPKQGRVTRVVLMGQADLRQGTSIETRFR